jgi:hypothetical protein
MKAVSTLYKHKNSWRIKCIWIKMPVLKMLVISINNGM